MDWIRRNWPDLLIGFALLAVISGIVATLLTGGSLFPLGNSSNQGTSGGPPPRQTTTEVQQLPETPATQDPASAEISPLPLLPQIVDDPADNGVPDGVVDPLAEARGENGITEVETEAPQEPATSGNVVALRPGENPPPAATPPAAEPVNTPAATTANTPAATPPAASTPASTSVTTSGTAPSASQPYTVGVGAFLSAENAERQAGVFRSAGYPVVVAAQDNLTVVLVGPYSNESEADRVRDAISTGGFDVSPIVYTYRGDEAGTAAAAAPPAATPAPAATQPVATPAPAASTASGARYLQVGAYSSTENAQAQGSTLESLGYSVTQQQDGNLIRVLVGPFGSNDLTAAQNRLAAQGIDSVPR